MATVVDMEVEVEEVVMEVCKLLLPSFDNPVTCYMNKLVMFCEFSGQGGWGGSQGGGSSWNSGGYGQNSSGGGGYGGGYGSSGGGGPMRGGGYKQRSTPYGAGGK